MNTMSRVRVLAVLAASLVLASSASAGLFVQQSVTSSGEGQGLAMTVRAWADGKNVRVEYLESNNPIMSAGTYLLTTDGGENVYLVRPEEQTYSIWNMAEVFAMIGSLQEMTGGMVKLDFRDPFAETLSEADGGSVLGYATTHRQWRSGFTMDMKVAFMDQSNRSETLTDAWMTDEIDSEALGIWFGARLPTTGDPELDEVLTSGVENIDGLVLKLEQRTTTTNKKGKQSTTTTLMEVTELKQETPEGSLFVLPEHFVEAPLIPLAMAEEGDEGNPLKGLFGRKKRRGDG